MHKPRGQVWWEPDSCSHGRMGAKPEPPFPEEPCAPCVNQGLGVSRAAGSSVWILFSLKAILPLQGGMTSLTSRLMHTFTALVPLSNWPRANTSSWQKSSRSTTRRRPLILSSRLVEPLYLASLVKDTHKVCFPSSVLWGCVFHHLLWVPKSTTTTKLVLQDLFRQPGPAQTLENVCPESLTGYRKWPIG